MNCIKIEQSVYKATFVKHIWNNNKIKGKGSYNQIDCKMFYVSDNR